MQTAYETLRSDKKHELELASQEIDLYKTRFHES